MARYTGIRNNLNRIKKLLIDKMLMNEELVKVLYYPDESDPFNMPYPEDIGSLINKYIFKTNKAVGTITERGIFIFIKFMQRPSSSSGVYRDVDIMFEVLAHNESIDNLEDGDDRMLLVLDLIDDMVVNSRAEEWLGKVKYVGEYEINANTNFTGTRLVYRITQFS